MGTIAIPQPTIVPRDALAVSEQEFRQISLADGESRWELHDGLLREKPGMSVEHGDLRFVAYELRRQLDPRDYRLRAGHARVRRSPRNYSIPDVAVLPTAAVRALRQEPGSLDAYPDALPLVVEIWSPSTGKYDIDQKLPQYQQRGDEEIWRLHPYERTLRVWRRADGGYDEAVYRGGTVRPASLPGVEIDPDALFEA